MIHERMRQKILLPIFFYFFLPLGKAQKKEATFRVDSLVILKSERKLLVFFENKNVKIYNIGLGSQPTGPKRYQGDGRTPEGNYIICAKNEKTKYYKALVISYPLVKDKIWATKLKAKPGGNIEIHGLPKGYSDRSVPDAMNDWTAGCIAMKNADIAVLYPKIKIGIPICILP